MKTHITESELDDATHNLAFFLQNIGLTLGDDILCKLNENLNSFLHENASINVIPDNECTDPLKVKISKSRNVSCNANEEVVYEIDKACWESALAENDDNKEYALIELQRANKVVRISCESEIQEISEEFDVNVEDVT